VCFDTDGTGNMICAENLCAGCSATECFWNGDYADPKLECPPAGTDVCSTCTNNEVCFDTDGTGNMICAENLCAGCAECFWNGEYADPKMECIPAGTDVCSTCSSSEHCWATGDAANPMICAKDNCTGNCATNDAECAWNGDYAFPELTCMTLPNHPTTCRYDTDCMSELEYCTDNYTCMDTLPCASDADCPADAPKCSPKTTPADDDAAAPARRLRRRLLRRKLSFMTTLMVCKA